MTPARLTVNHSWVELFVSVLFVCCSSPRCGCPPTAGQQRSGAADLAVGAKQNCEHGTHIIKKGDRKGKEKQSVRWTQKRRKSRTGIPSLPWILVFNSRMESPDSQSIVNTLPVKVCSQMTRSKGPKLHTNDISTNLAR
jgi:hypothetical protein